MLRKRAVVDLERKISVATLGWPQPFALGAGCFGGNNRYFDLRGITWPEAIGVTEFEGKIISRAKNEDADESLVLGHNATTIGRYGLDLGVVGATLCLSAGGCVPFSSCNGGCLGAGHHESHPLIALYAQPRHVQWLLHAATKSGIGIFNEEDYLIAYSGELDAICRFASNLIEHRNLVKPESALSPSMRKQPDVPHGA